MSLDCATAVEVYSNSALISMFCGWFELENKFTIIT